MATKSLKDILYRIIDHITLRRTSFTPTVGASYAGYGGCYYEKIGKMVHVHIGISGLTANTNSNVYSMPTGYRPYATQAVVGRSSSTASLAYIAIGTGGVIGVTPQQTHATGDIFYFVP